ELRVRRGLGIRRTRHPTRRGAQQGAAGLRVRGPQPAQLQVGRNPMSNMLNLTLKVWRQAGPDAPGAFETYQTTIADDASFLEMLDYVNEELLADDREPITFDHD